MFKASVISKGVKSDFDNQQIAGFAPNAARVAYGTAGFRTIGTALPPIAYRCVFVVFCRSLAARLSTTVSNPLDAHHFVINPATIGDCGMMITASHNPAQDNGLKIVDPDGGMFTMEWEADATDVANIKNADQFGEVLATFAKAHLVMGTSGVTAAGNAGTNSDEAAAEGALWALLKDRPVRIHIGRDTRKSGDAILASIKAAAVAINKTFAPIVFGSGKTDQQTVIELVDHGILTTPTLHAMVYWNRHHHELPAGELGLADPALHKTFGCHHSSNNADNNSTTITTTGNAVTALTTSSSSNHGALLTSRHHGVADTVASAARKSLTNTLEMPINKAFNERLVFRSFVSLWEELGCATINKKVVIDCSNGVGTVVMRESLDLPLVVLPSDRAFLANHSPTEDVITVGKLVKLVTGIDFDLVHTEIADATALNKECGADHTQKTRVPSSVFRDELTKYVKANADSLTNEFRQYLAAHPHSVSGAAVNVTPAAAFCQVVGKRIAFYCFDGDADRVVAFAPCPCPAKAAALTADSTIDEMLAATTFELLDGDRIAVLLSSLVRDALKRTTSGVATSGTPDACKRRSNSGLNLTGSLSTSQVGNGGASNSTSHLKIGVVQTAYANGASTNYIMSKLHIPVVCAATGVKYLHPKAEAMEVGIYFEANGHGTALSSAALYGTAVTLEGSAAAKAAAAARSRSGSLSNTGSALGAGAVVPPGVTRPASGDNNKKATSTAANATTAADEEANYHANDRTIVPYLWFGGSSSNPSAAPPTPQQGLKNLLLLRYLLSQCCGDAIADMLACELSLAALDWTAFYWQTMYSDLPSITGKTVVKDPSVIKNTPDQRQATHPEGLQARIDAIVEACGGQKTLARSFVRPSGTEPIVRVYAEATTKEVTQELFSRVAEAVGQMCN